MKKNYPLILEKIYTLNSDVQLVIATIYNPYNKDDSHTYNYTTENLKIHDQVDLYLWNEDINKLGINTIIKNYSFQYGYKIVDVHKTFEDAYGNTKGEVTGFYGLNSILGIDIKDPHPDNNGQQVIYTLHLNTINQIQ